MATEYTGSDPRLMALESRLAKLGSLVVCFSGGVDSALLLACAHRALGERAIGLTGVSPSLAPSERDGAVQFAQQLGVQHVLVDTHEIDDPGYAQNPANRCYYCKRELYRVAASFARERGFDHVANGSNLDDLGDYRPGLDAAREASVLSPLVDEGIDKAEVRRLSRLLDLPVWDKPAAACLSSRLPYGTSVTQERLAQIGGLEADLRALGFRQVRVRWHETVARIEVSAEQMQHAFSPEVRSSMVDAGKRHGFKYVTLDLQGYRQGSHNEVLVGNALRVLS